MMSFLTEPPALSWPAVAAVVAAGLLLGMLAVLRRSGWWSFRLAVVVAVALAGSLFVAADVPARLRELVRAVRGLELVRPEWLVLLAAVPVVVLIGRGSLRGFGPRRRWLVISLRSLVVALLVVALAEPRVRQTTRDVTVIFVIDRSLSVPPDPDPVRRDLDGSSIDRRWERVRTFADDAVRRRGPGRRDDRVGYILFGRTPRLSSPALVDSLPIDERLAGPLDGEYTDIAAALKLALAAFPEGTGKRVVLISDGNENLGRAVEQARLFKQQGVAIDVLPLAVGHRNTSEVLVQAVEAPPSAVPGQWVPVRVLVRNAHPTRAVDGTLELVQLRGREPPRPVRLRGLPPVVPPGAVGVTLRPGLNGFEFLDLPDHDDSLTYRATFRPANLPGDRVANNTATAVVLARGRRRVLLLEEPTAAGSHAPLVETLRRAKSLVDVRPANGLPATGLGEFLSTYDCLVIADVPAERFTGPQMDAIRRQCVGQGMGLVMTGGPNSFGPGGYQNTAVEAALPVNCDIRSARGALKGGLVLVMHGSEMADGNEWQKRVGKLAVERLGPADMVGVLYYGAAAAWFVPFQTVGAEENRRRLLALIDKMNPGDMPDFDPFLQKAEETLSDPAHNLAVKHVVVLSDGDPLYGAAGKAAVARMTAKGITCSTVGVATHGGTEDARLREMAAATKGEFYSVKEPRDLPAIYTREARQVSRSFLVTEPFEPLLRTPTGPAAGLPDRLPPLHGFVRTTLKTGPLPVLAVEGPAVEDNRFPVAAYWQPGAGRAVAFTSDARGWSRDWAASPVYSQFWTQAVEWAMRPTESGRVSVFPEVRDGRVRLVVEVRDDADRPLAGVTPRAFVNPPREGEQPPTVTFARTGPGRFEGSFPATDAGAYFVNVRVSRGDADIDGRRVGVTVPYSPEFADLEPNPALLRHLAEITGGEVYPEDDAELAKIARAGTVFRPAPETVRALLPFWPGCLLAAALLFVVDVAARRLTPDFPALWAAAVARWRHLRTRYAAPPASPGLDRLLEVKRAAAPPRDHPPPPPASDTPVSLPPPTPPPAPPVPLPPEPPAADDDYLGRLNRAKRRGRPESGEPGA